jgi:hypothetical protein
MKDGNCFLQFTTHIALPTFDRLVTLSSPTTGPIFQTTTKTGKIWAELTKVKQS